MREKVTAWITKYALTKGILKERGELVDERMIHLDCGAFAFGEDWHLTREAAIARAEAMREKKIASMKKKITKLKKLNFEEIVPE